MKRNYRDYIPEFVLLNKEDNSGAPLGAQAKAGFLMKPIAKLSEAMRVDVMRHRKAGHNVDNRPHYKRIIANSISVIRYGGGYTEDTYRYLKAYCDKHGYIIAPIEWDLHGSSWGVAHVSAADHTHDILKEMDIEEEMYRLSKPKFFARLKKVIGVKDEVTPPRVVLISDSPDSEGIAFAHPDWMEANDIPYGAKLTGPVKCLVIPMNIPIDGVDLMLPNGENKLGLSTDKLSKLIGIVRNASPEFRFSKNLERMSGKLGRFPVNGFDFQSICGNVTTPNLSVEKAFYETGIMPEGFLEMVFGYVDKAGVDCLTYEGKKIKAGMDPFDPTIRKGVLKALTTVIWSKLKGKLPGVYGVAMPLHLLPEGVAEVKQGYLNRWPWALPIYGDYAIYEHCIFVDSALWKLYGGDFDGDLACVLDGASARTGIVYNRDKALLESIMIAPTKEEAPDMEFADAVCETLKHRASCGSVFNSGKIVVDCARAAGWSRGKVLELEAKIYSGEVQPTIDGFKGKGSEKTLDAKGMCAKYGVPTDNLNHIQSAYIALRTRAGGLEAAIGVNHKIKADLNALSYYVRSIARNFGSWTLRADAPVKSK